MQLNFCERNVKPMCIFFCLLTHWKLKLSKGFAHMRWQVLVYFMAQLLLCKGESTVLGMKMDMKGSKS